MKSPKLPYEGAAFVLLFAGLGCFLLSFGVMGLAPWTTLRNAVKLQAGAANPYFEEDGSDSPVGRGRKIYIQEGCWHCHSQFVRPVAGEPYRYGPASEAWESLYDIPQSYGTRRIGPDLSREAGRRSDDWHMAHLYNPRSVAPLSVMPSYRWLFEGSAGAPQPNQAARDLVAYLQQLGKPHEKSIRAIVYPDYFKVSGAPHLDEISFKRGEELFGEHCSGCHGTKGDGAGLAKPFLAPAAANLVDRYVSTSEAYAILNRGVLGSAMPSFREMPERDLWTIALFVSELGKNTKEEVLRAAHTPSESGAKLFAEKCAFCHGEKGGGDGTLAGGLNPRPKDFSRRLFKKSYFQVILHEGITGSAMPPFSGLSESEVSALYEFVQSLYQEGL